MISNLESNIPQELLKELGRAGGRLWIGIPREIRRGEQRLALTPEAVDILVMAGHKVWVETDAGLGISYSDNHYSEAGAEIVSSPAEVYQADIILKILPPTLQETANDSFFFRAATTDQPGNISHDVRKKDKCRCL